VPAESPEARFTALVASFAADPAVDAVRGGTAFGAETLRSGGRIFAMLARDRLVVRLTAPRVEELVAAGEGERFDPGHGRRMKGWLSLGPDSALSWEDLAAEALRSL
jgi:hypothetical protein